MFSVPLTLPPRLDNQERSFQISKALKSSVVQELSND